MNDTTTLPVPATEPPPDCPRCGKPPDLCVCEGIEPIATRTALLILQHPQEQDKELGTARLTALQIKGAIHRIGLSWPSLSKIVGREVDPQRWAILYLGSARAEALMPERDIIVLNKAGQPEPMQDSALKGIEGIILLDGTWSQAKALWWRNAWMLKCRRIILNPAAPSRYGKLRKEPRRDGLSTIEAAGMLLSRLDRNETIEAALNETFNALLVRYRAVRKPPPKIDWRNRKRRPPSRRPPRSG